MEDNKGESRDRGRVVEMGTVCEIQEGKHQHLNIPSKKWLSGMLN